MKNTVEGIDNIINQVEKQISELDDRVVEITAEQIKKKELKERRPGLCSWPSGKDAICRCRRHRSDPRSGKILHAVEHLSRYAAIAEPVL